MYVERVIHIVHCPPIISVQSQCTCRWTGPCAGKDGGRQYSCCGGAMTSRSPGDDTSPGIRCSLQTHCPHLMAIDYTIHLSQLCLLPLSPRVAVPQDLWTPPCCRDAGASGDGAGCSVPKSDGDRETVRSCSPQPHRVGPSGEWPRKHYRWHANDGSDDAGHVVLLHPLLRCGSFRTGIERRNTATT